MLRYAVLAASLAAGLAEATTYNCTFTWYGAGDTRGSPNCNTNTAACGFYSYVRLSIRRTSNALTELLSPDTRLLYRKISTAPVQVKAQAQNAENVSRSMSCTT